MSWTDEQRAPGTPAQDAADQRETPYLEALGDYAARDAGRFHVPGHKGGIGGPAVLAGRIGEALELDVPSATPGIDVGEHPTPLEEAERLAAEAWGAARTWFLVNGASEGSHAACLAVAQVAERMVVQRNAHSSTMHALVLAGSRPTFVAPEIDHELGIAQCITVEALDRAFRETPGVGAAIVVSPTYFGAAADVRALAELSHAHGAPLIVDEAWGAHFRFHEDLPEDALSAGADLVISGTHKLLGSLTQSAMLHMGRTAVEWLDEHALERALGLVRSTSPSSLLLGSLDAARRHATVDGHELLEEALEQMPLVRAAIGALPGLDVLDERLVGRRGVHAHDPFRLAIDLRGTGVHGHVLAGELRRRVDINLELVADAVVVAHFGLGEPVDHQGARLVDGLAEVLRRPLAPSTGSRGPRLAESPPPSGPLVLSPREAFFARHEELSLERAEGRISADSLVLYPPGIANVLPGERITGANIEHLLTMTRRGCVLRGTSGGSLERVRVVR